MEIQVPIKVTCGGCGVTLTTPDASAGKRAKCPKCGGAIPIPEAPQEEIYEVESSLFGGLPEPKMASSSAIKDERRPCRSCGEMILVDAVKCRYCGEVFDKSLKGVLNTPGNLNNPAWLIVRSGLATIYNCVGILFGTILLMFLLGVILGAMNAGPDRAAEPPAAMMIVFGIAGLVIMGSGIGILVGQVRCTNVPHESGAHGFAVGAILCLVANILLSLAGGATNSPALSGIGSLLSMIGSILFMLFIKRSATYLNNYELASSAKKFLIFGVVMFVGMIALGILAAVGAPVLVLIIGVGALVGGLISIAWSMRLIRGLMLTIDNGLDARRSPAVWE